MKSPMNTLAADKKLTSVTQYDLAPKCFIQQVLCKIAAPVTFSEQASNISSGQALTSLTCPSLTEEDFNANSSLSPARNRQTNPNLRNRLRNAGVRTPQRSSTSGRSAHRQTSPLRQVREARSPSPEGRFRAAYPCLETRGLVFPHNFNFAGTNEGTSPRGLGVSAGPMAGSPESLPQTSSGEPAVAHCPISQQEKSL